MRPISSTTLVLSLSSIRMRRSTTSIRSRQSARAFSADSLVIATLQFSYEGFQLNLEGCVVEIALDQVNDGAADHHRLDMFAGFGYVLRLGDTETHGQR